MTDAVETVKPALPLVTKRKIHRAGQGSVGNYVCIRKGDDIKRVKRKAGDTLVRVEGYSYCPRSVWKAEVRDKKGYVPTPVVAEEQPKPKKKKIKTDKPRKSKENA